MSRRAVTGDVPPIEPQPGVPTGGMFAKVTAVDGGDVTVTVDDYGTGQFFGPVPFTPITADVAEGDRVFLHFDDQARPAYVAAFT